MTLLITKTHFSLWLSKLNTFTIPPFGLLKILGLGPFYGLLSCRSKRSYAPTRLPRFMLATPPYGQLHGVQFGNPFMTISYYRSPLPATASDLWLPNSQTWNMQLLTNTFDNVAVQAISTVRPVPTNQEDILRWTPAKNGICTTKEIYRYLSAQNSIQLPHQGSRSISPQANQILQRVWRTKQLPSIIKTFTWRLIHRAISTAQRAARFSNHFDDHCSVCEAVEDDAHLFFHCHLSKAVWFSFSPPIRTDNLPQDTDGVQLIIQSLISNTTSDTLFCKILITLWYIWKARNDKLFHQKSWTPIQVHNVAAAHFNTHTQAILPLASITSSKGTSTQINTSRQDAQITFAAIQGHDAATNNSTETTKHRSD